MASPQKSKKNRTKPPRGRPAATSAISQPVVEDASQLTAFSSFSPNGNLFAFLSLAVDKHRLRVFDTAISQSIAEHVVDSARVSSLSWSIFDPSDASRNVVADVDEPPNKKKRKKRASLANGDTSLPQINTALEVVLLGLSDGTVLFFSPTHGRVIRTLSHSTSTAAILSVVLKQTGDSAPTTWTSGADGAIRLWNAHKNDFLGSWKTDDRIPYSSLAIRPTTDDSVDVLVANHSIRLLSSNAETLTEQPTQVASFTGHASPVKQLQWDASNAPPTRFMSMAEGDRIVSIWETPENSAVEGKMVASVQLDSDARAISLSASAASSERQNLLTLTASGKISIFPIPAEIVPPASSSRTQHKVSSLLPRSNLSTSSKTGPGVQIVAASFAADVVGHIRVARLVGGVRPVFDLVQYLNDNGDFIPDVTIEDVKADLVSDTLSAAPNKRYTESASVAVRSGVELGQDEAMDDIAPNAIDGELDVDLAELSLGQRLTALSGDARPITSSDSDDDAPTQKSKATRRKSQSEANGDGTFVPANSLTRTLIQALHSSDTKLLETCLAHSDQTLIRNTVRRLPPQLAVPLITACVERLGRGARAGNMKGGGGGASSQRATTLIVWVKTVLTVHSGHLMTMPDLVARLSGLHATLSSRLALQETLLTLSGRLDMVLSQIEMRSSVAPATLAPRKPAQVQGNRVTRYVEGESADEDEQMDVEVEVDSGDDGASVEDVELGDDSSEDGSEDEEDDEDDEEGNDFIDDEAEEEEEYSENESESD
ncbi:U3 small nucleolar RNA-associated protein 5 [Favolaschia claudopus]|uniref:U3 small nucleolar RNA-associated protein 5 n=1 Tax=Favolaschia claudopus TaxID=2862362 RepID=A0AAW0EK08_9AGAR